MKYLITIGLVLFSSLLLADENSIQLNGLSHHFVEGDYNETNYGLGYTRELDVQESYLAETHQQISVGYYKNSFDKDTFYAFYGRAWQITDDFSVSLNGGLVTGYTEKFDHSVGEFSPVVFPAFEYKRVRVLVTPQVIAASFNLIEW